MASQIRYVVRVSPVEVRAVPPKRADTMVAPEVTDAVLVVSGIGKRAWAVDLAFKGARPDMQTHRSWITIHTL